MGNFAAAWGSRAAQIYYLGIRVEYKRQLLGSRNDDKRPIVYATIGNDNGRLQFRNLVRGCLIM